MRCARLVDKGQKIWLVGQPGKWQADSACYATFELADTGERLTFSVRPALYADLGEPRSALLTSQGTRFLAFGAEEEAGELMSQC